MTKRGAPSFVVFWSAVISAACGGIIGDDEPNVISTSGDAGAHFDGASTIDASVSTDSAWSCLGNVTLQTPFKSLLSWRVEPVNVTNAATFTGLAVQACDADDPTCAIPISSVTDASGDAPISLSAGQTGFDGFWQTQPEGDLLNLYFNNVPIVDDVQIDDRQTWSRGALTIALGSAGATWDETKGVVGFQVHDCRSRYLRQDQPITDDQATAAGVLLSIDPPNADIVLGYLDGDTVSLTRGQTDSSGEGAFVNVPEGWVTITATLAATNQKIGSARIYSKAGAISSAILSPQ